MEKTTFKEISKFYYNLYFNSLKEAIESSDITEEKGMKFVKLFEKKELIEIINNEIKFTKKGTECMVCLIHINEHQNKNIEVAFQD